jgi:predicted ATPase
MGPDRATAERYYRTQDLAVDEVDYQGRNLAMFLRNLTEAERKNFENWTLRYFGFAVLIETSLGHISIKIRYEKSDRKVNVADTGFGFSQILPIITQLWLLTTSPRRNSQASRRSRKGTLIFSIEQPELHLHPHLQGILTDAFISSIKAASKQDVNLRLIIETHSEILVNRLGHLVAKGKVSPEDINVVFFEQLDESGKTSVRTINFNADGYLSNWPIGFFDMDLDWDAE